MDSGGCDFLGRPRGRLTASADGRGWIRGRPRGRLLDSPGTFPSVGTVGTEVFSL